jgi:DNA-binding transcriptional LysR family regulator
MCHVWQEGLNETRDVAPTEGFRKRGSTLELYARRRGIASHTTCSFHAGQRARRTRGGLPLFEQLGRKVYLTQAGAEMLVVCRASRPRGERVDVISAGDYFFPRLLAEFARRHSGAILNPTVHNRAELLHQLADNLTVLAIMVRPPEDMDTVNEPFAPHPYVIVAAAGHPLAAKTRIPLAALAREPFLAREKGSDTRASMARGFAGWLAKLNIAMELKSTETIKQAVIAGMGVAFLSAHTVTLERQVGSRAQQRSKSRPGSWH